MNINDRVTKNECEKSFEFFVRYMFFHYYDFKFNVKPFHKTLFKTFEDIYDGKHNRVIINIPPRHSKTEMAKMFIAWVLAKNPKAKSLVLSYSNKLAEKNSSQIRDYVACDAFQRLWPMPLKSDNKGKANWETELRGECYGTSAGGQVTGFGAGLDGQGCHGGLILIDDPLKPDDALYDTARTAVNDNFVGTIKSRRNDTNVPIVIIMQRIHEEDLSGYLLNGGDGEKWHHVKIPVWDENHEVIWPERYSQQEANTANNSQPYVFAGQYLQEPAPLDGGIWKKDWFEIVESNTVPEGIKWEMYIDGAYTKDTNKDPTGIMIAGVHRESVDGKVTKTLYVKHNKAKHLEMPNLITYVDKLYSSTNCSMVLIEPRASGKSLKQMLSKMTSVNVKELKSRWGSKSKIDKAHDTAPYIEGGRVKLIKDDWNRAFLHQVSLFPNGKHDEDIDNTSYAVERVLMRKQIKVY